jgi:hypothetical protein
MKRRARHMTNHWRRGNEDPHRSRMISRKLRSSEYRMVYCPGSGMETRNDASST